MLDEPYKKRKRKKRNPWPARIVWSLLILLFSLLVLRGVKHALLPYILTTSNTAIATLEEPITGDGLLILHELPIIAPYTGNAKRLVENGVRVRDGQDILQLTSIGTNIQGKNLGTTLSTPDAGMAIYWHDGLEGLLNKDILGNGKLEQLFSHLNTIESGSTVSKGEMAAKVVDNLTDIYLLCRFPQQSNLTLPQKNEKCTLYVSDYKVSGTIYDQKNDAKYNYYVINLNDYPPGFNKQRAQKCALVLNSYKGIILPKTALVTKNNNQGVLIIESAVAKFNPVQVLGTVGEKVVVSGLPINKEVILNPNWINEGEIAE